MNLILNKNHPLANRLIACYMLNENGGQKAFNLANTNQIGEMSGGAVFNNTTKNGEVDFNGVRFSGSKIIVSNPWSDTPTSYTISCWFKASDIASVRFLLNWRNISNAAIWFQANTNSSRIDFTVGDSGGYANCLSGTLSNNTWYQFVGVRNNNDIYNYINGVYQSTGNRAFSAPTGVVDCVIGAQSQNYDADWLGKISQVQIWKRALSSTEIMSLYKNPYQHFFKLYPNKLYQPTPIVVNTTNFFNFM